jgi:quinol monooxygenase YgiN
MVVVIAVMKAKAGMEQAFENTLRELISKVEAEEGTLVYTLHRAKKEPTRFLMYEKYVNEEAFAQHGSSPYFKKIFGMMASMIDGAPSIDVYEELAGIKEKKNSI